MTKRTRTTIKPKSVANRILEGLEDFATSLKNGESIEGNYNCHKVILDLSPTAYDPDLVKATRKLLGCSQFIFAQFLGVSVQTVQAWEQGRNEPRDVACRFMDEIRLDPKYWKDRIQKSMRQKVRAD